MANCIFSWFVAAIEIADQCFAQLGALQQSGTIGRQAAAQRADHPAYMFADHDVANAFLPQLAVHVIDEQFGQPNAFLRRIQRFQPHQHLRQNGNDHVKPPIDRVGRLAFQIPMGLAPFVDDGLIERLHRVLWIGAREQTLEEVGHDEAVSWLNGTEAPLPGLAHFHIDRQAA